VTSPTSPTSVLDGFYAIGVTATNSAAPTSTTSAAATYVVASSLAVTVTTDSASYSLNQWVTITASVLLGQHASLDSAIFGDATASFDVVP